MANFDTGMDDTKNYTHFIAIDFGTSGSGIAVWGKTYEKTEIYTNPKWVPGQKGVAVKCPTALLLDPDGEFEAFGLKAIENYQGKQGLRCPEKSDDYYLFNRFKMCLYDEKYLSRDMKIRASNGKELPAHVVIAKSLKEMKTMILDSLNEEIGCSIDRVLWIVTVPAIWSPGAKQIMREAATEAGLGVDKGSSLLLVLEPEAAAMFCQQEILDVPQDPNSTSHYYLVVDCGGGTVDIAAHKLTKASDSNISIEEMHQAHGGPHGGFAVNDEFEKMLEKLFQLTQKDFDKLKCKFARFWVKLLYKEFEDSKCRCDSGSPTPITISFQRKVISYVEKITGKDITQLVEEYTRHKIEWDDDEDALVLPFSTINSLFAPVISQIIMAIKEVLTKPECQCIEKILLVGGFAESNILFEGVKKEFSPAIMVKKSKVPSLSVLKGAIIYGRNQNIIKSRKMCQSLGIETWDSFDPGIHDENRKVESDGKAYCSKVFTKFVEINESVDVKTKIEHSFPLTSKDQGNCRIQIFGSRHNKTFYTDEESCYEIGVLNILNLPKHESGKSQEVLVAFNVSGTEVTVSAYCDGVEVQELLANLDFVKDEYTKKK